MFGFLPGASFCCSRAASTYRAHFCGLCNVLRADYGLWARGLINRDSTFLALLGNALSETGPATCNTTCCNPWAEPRELLAHSPIMSYAAAVTMCGLATKLEDDAEDERGLRGLAARVGSWSLQEAQAGAVGLLHQMGFPVPKVINQLRGQKETETQGPGLTCAAESTCSAFGEITAFAEDVAGHSRPKVRECLREMGRSLGILIYFKDALDDWQKDRRRRRFNPLSRYLTVEERCREIEPLVREALANLKQALASLPLTRNRDLLSMVLVEGAGRRVEEMLHTEGGAQRPLTSVIRRAPESLNEGRKKKRHCCDRCDCCDCSGCHCPRGGGGAGCCDCNPCDGDCCGCDCSC